MQAERGLQKVASL